MKKKKNAINKNDNAAGLILLLPLLIFFITLLGYSFYFLIHYSFYNVTISFKDPSFVGLNNFTVLLKDKIFWGSMIHTFLVAFSNIFWGLTLGFFISVILSIRFKGNSFFHALFFIPSMLPIALMASVFSSMLESKNGIVNQLLRGVGLKALALRWLTDPNLALWSVCSVSIYLIGIPIMYYSADLTTIDESIFEAATMDGAKMHHQLFLIIYPLLKNTHKTIILSMLLSGFREMERVFLMTDGGPGGSTEIIGTYIYRASRSAGSNIGMVCAASLIVLLVALLIAVVQMKVMKEDQS